MAAADTCCMRGGWDLSFLDSEAGHLHFSRKGDFHRRSPLWSSSVRPSNPLGSVVRRSSNSSSRQVSPQTTTSTGATSRSPPEASLVDDLFDHVYQNQTTPSCDVVRSRGVGCRSTTSSSSSSSSSSEDDMATSTPSADHRSHASVRCSFLQAPVSSVCRSSRSPVVTQTTSLVFPSQDCAAAHSLAVLGQSEQSNGDVYARVTRCLSFWNDDQLSTTFRRLSLCRFYLGRVSFDEAKVLLRRHPVGTFLLRDSSDDRFAFALSVQTRRGTTSIRIVCECGGGRFRLDCEEEQIHLMPTFDCVVALVQFYVYQGERRKTPNNLVLQEMNGRRDLPVLLRRPYETSAPSLAHLSRKRINGMMGGKNISRLQLLPSLKDYLSDYPYAV